MNVEAGNHEKTEKKSILGCNRSKGKNFFVYLGGIFNVYPTQTTQYAKTQSAADSPDHVQSNGMRIVAGRPLNGPSEGRECGRPG